MSESEPTDAELLAEYHQHMNAAREMLAAMGTTGGVFGRSHRALQLLVENEYGDNPEVSVDLSEMFHTGDGSELPSFEDLESELDPGDSDPTQ